MFCQIGRYFLPDGIFYAGHFVNGLKHGYGIIEIYDRTDILILKYEGEWANNVKNGSGWIKKINFILFILFF